MMLDVDECSKLGLYFNNVKKVILNNVSIQDAVGKKVILNNVGEFLENSNEN